MSVRSSQAKNDPVTGVLRAAPIVAAAAVCALFLVRLWIELTTGQALNIVSGVWLALAWDADAGIFYRSISESGAYGGTRYFPLLFLLVAAFMRVGLDVIAAAHAASVVSAVILASGIFRFLTSLGLRRPHPGLGMVLAVAPYFVQQGIFAIRSEPLAAGFVMWGAASVARRLGGLADGKWAGRAAIFFALAVAAKPTAAYGGIAAVAALVAARRHADAFRLGAVSVALWFSVLLVIHVGSGGRAIESFRTLALAGGSLSGVLKPQGLWVSLLRLLDSRLLAVVLAGSIGALFHARAWTALPTWLMAGAVGASVVTLGTAGTILTNQGIEPYVAAAALLVWILARQSFARAGSLVLTALLLWTSAQNARELRWLLTKSSPDVVIGRTAAIGAARRCRIPWIAESPLLPVVSGYRPLLLDPFAFRVAAERNPELARDLVQRIERSEFGCVVLEYDPLTEAGRRWYRNVDLGEQVIGAVMTHYRFDESIGGYRFYVPVSPTQPNRHER